MKVKLTPRQLELATMAYNNPEKSLEAMAIDLFITYNTVKAHLEDVYTKFGIKGNFRRKRMIELINQHGWEMFE